MTEEEGVYLPAEPLTEQEVMEIAGGELLDLVQCCQDEDFSPNDLSDRLIQLIAFLNSAGVKP